jgi:hypothetical protein
MAISPRFCNEINKIYAWDRSVTVGCHVLEISSMLTGRAISNRLG